MRVKNVLLFTKAGDPDALELGADIARWFTHRGYVAEYREVAPHQPADYSGLSFTPDLVLVLGGDGTMLGVARRMEFNHPVPLLGVNLGRVGFLTELERADWEDRLATILEHDFPFSTRMRLHYSVLRHGHPVREGRVLNDLVINRGALARLISMDVHVNGEFLGSARADGLVISTPTGSTAYSVSAGGPLVHPDLEMLNVTPICPFLNSFPSLALPPASELDVTLPPTRADVMLTLDGQEGFHLHDGDMIRIRRSDQPVYFIQPPWSSYARKLLSKGFIRNNRYCGAEEGDDHE